MTREATEAASRFMAHPSIRPLPYSGRTGVLTRLSSICPVRPELRSVSKGNGASLRLSSGRRGLTLIELILVMGLLAMVMALAAPRLSRFFEGRTLQEEARRLLDV